MLLMIDNYDSFTYNLVQYFAELGEEVQVLRNDEIDVAGIGAIDAFSGQLPILGVCLGHQAIGAALGGRVIRAQTQMHGKTDVITTDERGVYTALPREFTVIRYHSLEIERATLPSSLEVTATSQDGEIMGVRHRELAGTKTPLEGVQFHPESILTEHGHAMLKNFLELRP